MTATMREPEGIKLFIGQVPREYTESDIRSLFEPYGDIHSFNLLEDKATGQHKGCAFLTFYSNESATAAQEDLHGKKTLPGARNPMQVKPAASEVSPENRKLFCGMLSKSLTEDELISMFSPYGTIQDLTILKGKGCAFILYENRLQAQNAIKAMHHSQTMEGCSSPMVVKLADSEKDKMTKQIMKQGAVTSAVVSAGQMPDGNTISQLQQHTAYYQQLFNQLVLPQILAGNLPSPGSPGAVGALVAAMAAQAQTLDQQSAASVASVPNQLTQAFSGAQQYQNALQQHNYNTFQQTATPIDNKQKEGPDGANLFIYQIPTEYSDSDLMQLFTPFGNVISAKVFLDKVTQMSKGFGFVSYENTTSANNAITAMNGFVIGTKRLRVTLKRKKESKPY